MNRKTDIRRDRGRPTEPSRAGDLEKVQYLAVCFEKFADLYKKK